MTYIPNINIPVVIKEYNRATINAHESKKLERIESPCKSTWKNIEWFAYLNYIKFKINAKFQKILIFLQKLSAKMNVKFS